MKKTLRFLSLVLCMAMLLSMGLSAYADGNVTYDGRSRSFIFGPGSIFSPTDLFPDFKNVMPGDTLTERIVINNSTFYGVKINLYMRSLGAQQNTNDFLSQLDLNVDLVNKTNMFKAPADQTAQLTDWTFLGTIYSGGKVELDVTLKVPRDLDNKYQHDIGYIDWQFMVEELPVSPDDPRTGDDSNVLLYAAFAGASLAVAFVLLFVVKRRKKAED